VRGNHDPIIRCDCERVLDHESSFIHVDEESLTASIQCCPRVRGQW